MESNVTVEVQHLWLSVSLFIFIVFILNQTKIFRQALVERQISLQSKLLFIITFSCIGIFGTYWGIRLPDGIINTRAAGVITGGLVGGPVVGCFTGLFTGLHRMAFVDTLTSDESGLITIFQGAASGFLSPWLKKKKQMWLWAFVIGAVLEIVHLGMLLVLAGPHERVIGLVKALMPPMVITNSAAICLFIGILENSLKERERAVVQAAKASFRSVHLVLDVLRADVSAVSGEKITRIIMDAVPDLAWAVFLVNGRVNTFAVARGLREDSVKKEAEAWVRKGASALSPDSMMVPVEGGDMLRGYLAIKKTENRAFSSYEKELILGSKRILEFVLEFDRLKKQESLFSAAEIKALQAQINPHFLFNALNTISYYCRSDPAEARKLVLYLADYYRQNLSSPNTMITLHQELHHVQAYVNIEQARFGDRLKVNYRIEEDNFHIPALIMQPLVENALRHGILSKAEGGTVSIGAVSRGDHYRLYVCDDGVGMTRERVKNLLIEDPNRTSIGLINVHGRLRSIYGGKNGLRIRSCPGRGTLVSFEIPKERSDDHDQSSYSR